MALPDHEAERVAGRITVDPPADRFAIRPGPGRHVLGDRHRARGNDPLVGRRQVLDQDVDVNPERVPHPRSAAGLEGEPLAMRGRLERDPSRIPLHRGTAEQASPEPRECPWLGAVKDHFPDPADRRIFAHRIIMAQARAVQLAGS